MSKHMKMNGNELHKGGRNEHLLGYKSIYNRNADVLEGRVASYIAFHSVRDENKDPVNH